MATRITNSNELLKFTKFVTVGVLGTILNLSVFFIVYNLAGNYVLAGVLAGESAILLNFFLNMSWTFREESRTSSVLHALKRDHLVRINGILINVIVLWILIDFFNVFYMLSQVVGGGASVLWNYNGNKFWTWK